MMKRFRKVFCALFAIAAVATAVPVGNASAAGCNRNSHFLGLRAWYDGLVTDNCEIIKPTNDNEAKQYVWTIILNVASLIMGVTGYAAIGFVVWGGIQYMLAQGDPGKVAKGKKTITNAIIGIIIVASASIISGMVADIVNGASQANGSAFMKSILNHVFLWSGILAVIMVVYGGIQYATSAGNPQAAAKGKTTIMYSMIGLIIVILAASIVSMVMGSIDK